MSTSTKKINKIQGKSKKYSANADIINAETNNGVVSVEKAIETLQKLEAPKFKDGPSVELHVKLNINATKSDQLVRASVVLPHGTGKSVRIAAFVTPENEALAKKLGATKVGGEELINEIKESGKIDFDIAIAQPEIMKLLPPIARTLGTAGVMPNPKTGTVGDDIEDIIKTILAGKVDFKNDKSGNVHILVGKLNTKFDTNKLVENINSAIESIEKAKPEVIKKKYIVSAHIASTMSPSIRVR
ncbi:MAG: 50S ribosomal protein L1 [Patescibacteria group bacterium]